MARSNRNGPARADNDELGPFDLKLASVRRIRLGKMANPIRGFLHGGAALAALAGLVLLLNEAWGRAPAVTGALIFGLATIAMFTISSLYHSIPWNRRWKRRLQRVDHSMIFLVVAGTYTPVAIASLDGLSLAISLGVVWTIAITGILLKALLPAIKTGLSVTLQMVMGWSALMWMPWIWAELGTAAIVLIAVGGFCYTIGAVVFATKRPMLFRRSFSYHELFHVLVIAGCVFHFLVIFIYAIPAA